MPPKRLTMPPAQTMTLAERITEEEFEAWCDEDVRAEFVDGEVIVLSPETLLDERLRWWLGGILSLYAEHHDLGEVFGPNLQVRLRPKLRRLPDLIFVVKRRLNLLQRTRLEGAPDLALEIVSEDSTKRDFRIKFAEYERYGVREYWLIVPMTQRIYAYRRGRDGKFHPIPMPEGILRSQVVKGFWLKVNWLWEEPLPPKEWVLRQLGVFSS